jgi:hypothetical protein
MPKVRLFVKEYEIRRTTFINDPLRKLLFFETLYFMEMGKVFVTFDNIFHVSLMSGLKKYAKKKKIHSGFFFLNPLYPF